MTAVFFKVNINKMSQKTHLHKTVVNAVLDVHIHCITVK